jgi:hypothetical protein
MRILKVFPPSQNARLRIVGEPCLAYSTVTVTSMKGFAYVRELVNDISQRWFVCTAV